MILPDADAAQALALLDALSALLGRPRPDAWYRNLRAGDKVRTVAAAKLFRDPAMITWPLRDVAAGQVMDVFASLSYGGACWYPGKPDTVCVYSKGGAEFWVPAHALIKG